MGPNGGRFWRSWRRFRFTTEHLYSFSPSHVQAPPPRHIRSGANRSTAHAPSVLGEVAMKKFILAGAFASALAVSNTSVAQQQTEEAVEPQSDEMAECRVGLLLGPGESCHVPDGARFGVRDDGCVGERLGFQFLSIFGLEMPVSTDGDSVSYSVGHSETQTTWDEGPDGERTNQRTVSCVSGHIQLGGFRATEVKGNNTASSWRIDELPSAAGDVRSGDVRSGTE